MAKWCDQGESSVGNVFLKGSTAPTLYLGLYANSSEPAESATMSDITEVHTIGQNGYARIALTDSDWTESPTGTFTNLQKTFTASGSSWSNAYGYYLTTTSTGTGGSLVAVEHFTDGPYEIQDGWSVKVTPKVTVS
jgi:hypothetical protein